MKTNLLHRILIPIIGLFLVNTSMLAQTWQAPADAAAVKNPFEGDKAKVARGQEVFLANCKSCHGDPGAANFLPLNPPPGDFASEKFLSQTDGALFWKITEGKLPMPSFKTTLSDDDRWAVVAYTRSLANALPAEAPKGMFDGKKVAVALTVNTEKRAVSAKVTFAENGVEQPAAGLKVRFGVKRTFANQWLSNTMITDAEGWAHFTYPEGVRADSEGKFIAVAELPDQKLSVTETVTFGSAFTGKNLLDERSLWTVRTMAPWWLYITFFGTVLGVWAFIGIIALNIFKIYKLGQTKK